MRRRAPARRRERRPRGGSAHAQRHLRPQEVGAAGTRRVSPHLNYLILFYQWPHITESSGLEGILRYRVQPPCQSRSCIDGGGARAVGFHLLVELVELWIPVCV